MNYKKHATVFVVLTITAMTFISITEINESGVLLKTTLIYKHLSTLGHLFYLKFKRQSTCRASGPYLQSVTKPFSAIVVETCGTFLERVHQFNVALDVIRSDQLNSSKGDWNLSAPGKLQMLYEWNDDFFQSLSNYSHIKMIILPWIQNSKTPQEWSSLNDNTNILVQNYFESTASDTLCTWIETPGKVSFGFDMINNWTCHRNITNGVVAKSVSLLALNIKAPYKNYYNPTVFPSHYFTRLPISVYHMYVIQNGIINGVGDVFSKNTKLVPYGCYPILALNPPPPDVNKIPLYKEVLVIAQHRGTETYHRMSEVTPRIAMFVEFLRRNPTVMVFALLKEGRVTELLETLGIKKERIIIGWNRAEIVYLPRSEMCCFPHFTEHQVLSNLFRTYIKQKFPNSKRNKVVVIRRSHRRRFQYQTEIEKVVEEAAKNYNLSFDVYKDNPGPTLDETIRLFNSAVMVVGSHGAGLANLIFSEPGTYVVEGVCQVPYTNLFFQRTALVLGHRWHGIAGTGGCTIPAVSGVVNVSASAINSTVLKYLEHLSTQGS